MSNLTLLLLLALTLPAFSQQPQQQPATLAEMRDHYRPLLIFQSGKDERLNEQLRLLTAHRTELLDRQIMLDLRPYAWAGTVDHAILTWRSWEEDKALRTRFHIHPNDFTVILLGKDGGEKFRSYTPVSIEQLTRIIDAMPMRQLEMRTHPQH